MDVNLVMFKNDGQRKDFSVKTSVTVIGRGENCDLRVPLVSVSRRHCEVTVAGLTIRAKDLASSNGTYVNNKRITEVELRAGDRLVVGPIVFTVQIDGVPEEIKPVKTKAESPMDEQVAVADAEVVDLASAGEPIIEPARPARTAGQATAVLEPTEELDPIAALEALAAENQEAEKKARP